MESLLNPEIKPERLYFKTYLQLIRNSVGTSMFRNFYIKTADGVEADAMSDGSNSCAFYVSGVLTLFGKHSGIHGTVKSTVEDLRSSGWQTVPEVLIEPGDVVLWEEMEFEGAMYEHLGFYIGDSKAVSASWTEKQIVEHDLHFGDTQRAIKQVYRQEDWS